MHNFENLRINQPLSAADCIAELSEVTGLDDEGIKESFHLLATLPVVGVQFRLRCEADAVIIEADFIEAGFQEIGVVSFSNDIAELPARRPILSQLDEANLIEMKRLLRVPQVKEIPVEFVILIGLDSLMRGHLSHVEIYELTNLFSLERIGSPTTRRRLELSFIAVTGDRDLASEYADLIEKDRVSPTIRPSGGSPRPSLPLGYSGAARLNQLIEMMDRCLPNLSQLLRGKSIDAPLLQAPQFLSPTRNLPLTGDSIYTVEDFDDHEEFRSRIEELKGDETIDIETGCGPSGESRIYWRKNIFKVGDRLKLTEAGEVYAFTEITSRGASLAAILWNVKSFERDEDGVMYAIFGSADGYSGKSIPLKYLDKQ